MCLILFSSFVVRLFLAGRNSYWVDEIISVAVYGVRHATVLSAIEELAARSNHPPLYQAILFSWMQLFGYGEVATRTLSNLYVTGATLWLYILALKLFGRRVAIASALVFAFSYSAIHFGGEVRSYAQSLFLVTLSSLLLLLWLERIPDRQRWGDIFNRWGIALLLCNTALLLTHYSNALFLFVQVMFVAAVLWHRSRPPATLAPVKAFAFYALPFAAAFAVWGPVALATGTRFRGDAKYAIAALPTKFPTSIFLDDVLAPNIALPGIAYAAVFLLVAAALVKVAVRYFVRAEKAPPLRAYFPFYLAGWALVPCVLAFFLFFALSAERYNVRYFAFCVPPLAILLVLAIEQAIEGLDAARAWLKFSLGRHYIRYALLYALLICAIFALPRGFAAATLTKEPYRETARALVELVEGTKGASFAIFEASRFSRPILNFYMIQMSDKVRAIGTIGPESKGRDPFRGVEDAMAGKDYLVVAFPHNRPARFPALMRRLNDDYDLVANQLFADGLGYMVWKKRAAANAP